MDNVLVAISLFLLVILLKDIITRIVYMRPRFSVPHDSITYFSQARILLLDNSFLFRWVRKFQVSDAGHYEQRNNIQYKLVMLATLCLFMVELGLVVAGLPANSPIYQDSDKMVRWESQYLDNGRILLPKYNPCIIAPVLEGPNLKSESLWRYCTTDLFAPSRFAQYPIDKMLLNVSNPKTTKGHLMVTLFGDGMLFQFKFAAYIPLHDDEIAVVGLSDDAVTFTRNLQRNFDLLRNTTGLTLTQSQKGKDGNLVFWVNASEVNLSASSLFPEKALNAGIWVGGLVQGILTLQADVNGSQLYEVEGQVNSSTHQAVPLKKTKILVGAYIGTLLPAFFIVAFTAGAILVHVVLCIFLISPPGGAWELLQAHGRDTRDRILAGPPGDVVYIQDTRDKHQEDLENN